MEPRDHRARRRGAAGPRRRFDERDVRPRREGRRRRRRGRGRRRGRLRRGGDHRVAGRGRGARAGARDAAQPHPRGDRAVQPAAPARAAARAHLVRAPDPQGGTTARPLRHRDDRRPAADGRGDGGGDAQPGLRPARAPQPRAVLGTTVEQKRRRKKDIQDNDAAFTKAFDAFKAELVDAGAVERARRRDLAPDPARTLRRAALPATTLWQRRAAATDFLTLHAGVGNVPWKPPVDQAAVKRAGDDVAQVVADAVLAAAPVEVELTHAGVVGIVGDRADALAVARSLLCQAVTHCGPADLTVGVFCDPGREEEWTWTGWLPHVRRLGDGSGGQWLSTERTRSESMLRAMRDGIDALPDAGRAAAARLRRPHRGPGRARPLAARARPPGGGARSSSSGRTPRSRASSSPPPRSSCRPPARRSSRSGATRAAPSAGRSTGSPSPTSCSPASASTPRAPAPPTWPGSTTPSSPSRAPRCPRSSGCPRCSASTR